MPRGKKKQASPKAKAAPEPSSPHPAAQCVICMTVPPAGEGPHHCGTCTAGAWVVCASCEQQIKGKRCPICRADYMRELSEWETLPADETILDLRQQPTQDELKRISARFTNLERLTICPEWEDEPEQLDFAADGVYFPELTYISLSGIGMTSITFTEANTPMLRHMELSNVQGDLCPFNLALPDLRHLEAEHTMLGERPIDAGQFGLSLSRCPKLERLQTYKFRCLGQCNYAVLPSMESMRLHRSECTTHLDILYAPRLRDVSLQAAYELGRGFKLRNLPQATVATVEALIASKLAAQESARVMAQAEDTRWRDQSNVKALTKEARRRGWIEKYEKWEVAATPPSMDHDDDDMWENEEMYDSVYEDVLQEYIEKIFDDEVEGAAKAAESEHLGASVHDAGLPRVTLDTTNMDGFRLSSLEPQVRSRCRVKKDAYDGFGFGGGDMDDDEYDDDEDDDDEDDDEDDEDDIDGDGWNGMEDPREHFMRMMMATGMPQMAGLQMMPGRMGSGAPPHMMPGRSRSSAGPSMPESGPIPLLPGEAQDPRRLLERVMNDFNTHSSRWGQAEPEDEEEEPPPLQPQPQSQRRTRSQSSRSMNWSQRGRNAGGSSQGADYAY